MSPSGKYFVYSGHAVGAAAHFHKLDDVQNLNHIIPTLGAAVLPGTGGRSVGHHENYAYQADVPRKRTLLYVRRVDTRVEGWPQGNAWVTEIDAEIESVRVLEKLDIGLVKVHTRSATPMDADGCQAVVTTNGSCIEGLRMGGIEAKITLDHEPLLFTTSRDTLADFYRKKDAGWRADNAHRFCTEPTAAEVHEVNGRIKFSLVKNIELIGAQDPEHQVRVEADGHTIKWDGFGRIILGEVFVKCCDRRITMVRLHMGSDGGGNGTIGDTSSNGSTGN
jgi:hypothetical protein